MNPSCPFCDAPLESGWKQSYHVRGIAMTAGRSRAWVCKSCGKFWWRGKQVILKGTALNVDRRSVIENVKSTIRGLLR